MPDRRLGSKRQHIKRERIPISSETEAAPDDRGTTMAQQDHDIDPFKVSSPRIFLVRMVVFLTLGALLVVILYKQIWTAFLANPGLNALIILVLLAGIIFAFRQVIRLFPEIAWVNGFRLADPGLAVERPPVLLAPMATILRDRVGRMAMSPQTMRGIMDSIANRLDEARDLSRYMTGLLVFLGLLGTFWGLIETVTSIRGVLEGLKVGGDPGQMFEALKEGLAAPLGGMGISFSSSLFGLAGSLVLGFLDLQAGQAQNRFYNELEEWLSTYTRLSAGPLGEGDGSVPAYIHALLEQTADSLDNLQRILARGEEGRIAANATLASLTDRLGGLGEQMKSGQILMVRLAENQLELKPALTRLADVVESSLGHDDVLRSHLRNIEAYIARLSEDVVQGREQSVQDLRGDIRIVARTIAALAEEPRR